MPRQAGTQLVNTFVGGLVTEATALSFPDKACTETWNCVFDETGRVTRRLGIDAEDPIGDVLSITKSSTNAVTEFRWDAVAGDGTRSFLVQQYGSTLYFFDISTSTNVRDNYTGLTVDLTDFEVSGTSAMNPCQYAAGRGRLVVVNRATDPILVSYNVAEATIETEAIDVQVRDFIGLDSGIGEATRPTETVANLIATNPFHYYNLLNQSWFIADALSQWDAGLTTLPSNRDYVPLFRESETDAWGAGYVTANTPGSRPAPKGHFILNAWCPDHEAAMAAEGFTATISSGEIQLSGSVGTNFGDITNGSGLDSHFDGETSEDSDSTIGFKANTTFGYAGKSYSPGVRITKSICFGSTDEGFWENDNPSTTITLYGKQGAAPANDTDGTVLGTLVFSDTTDESAGRTVTSSDTDTFWDHVWVRFSQSAGNAWLFPAEIQFFTIADQENTFCTALRPRCVEFFAGRTWYAGVDFERLSSNVYFSQIITKDDQYGKCYQANDPASEDFTDLLPDDGGVIVIPEIATITRLFAYQSALIVVATNGVWLITGGSQGGFLATDFVVKKISDEGSFSPLSFLAYKGVPAWFGENGIYTIQFDANYQSFAVVSLSDQKIKSFFDEIPRGSLPYVKGCFHIEEGIGVWLFSGDEDRTGYSYDSALLINGLSGAFYPWSFEPPDDDFDVQGIVYCRSPASSDATIKITVTSAGSIFYAESRQTTYKDWSYLAAINLVPSREKDYDSYFVTGYRLEGQGIRFFQPNYIIVYNENESGCGSCFVQGIYDFTTSGDSGKWSTRQQVFNNCLTHRNVTYARRKIRGKGRALQLRFSSESGKPFTIIGWAIWITGNASV